MIIASSMLYPSNERTATTQFCPRGLSSILRRSSVLVLTTGAWTDKQVLSNVRGDGVGRGGEAERLLRHRRLVGVPRRLVVLRVRDYRGCDSEHRRGEELEMSVFRADVV